MRKLGTMSWSSLLVRTFALVAALAPACAIAGAGTARLAVVCAETGFSDVESSRDRIDLDGQITAATPMQFAAMLYALTGCPDFGKHVPSYFVRVSSPGGDVAAALELGRQIRSTHGSVIVGAMPGDVGCHSACILVLAAGLERIAGKRAQLSLHRPYFSDGAAVSDERRQRNFRAMAVAVRAYLHEMHLTDALFDAMMAVAPGTAKPLGNDEARSLGLIGVDPVLQAERDLAAAKATGLVRARSP